MNDARLAELREKYKNRNLLEELAWGIYADHSGYTPKQSGEFLNWLCNMAYRAIKGQQKAWIPVSKRLPEEETRVLIFTVDGEIDIADHRLQEWTTDDWEWFVCGTLGYARTYCDNEVVVWMPLPEPYKEMEGIE